MKILVTGFDPFGEDRVNPAIEAVKRLPNEIAGAQIIKKEIPTVFGECARVVHGAIVQAKPDYVLNIGQAGGRSAITPELVAINLDDGRIADNQGHQPIGTPIQKDGQNAYFSQLPVKAMVQAICQVGLPATLSTTAGTFVCNHIMYQVQYMIDKEFHRLKAGFLHIPFLPEQVVNHTGMPSLSLLDDVRGITAAIEAIVYLDGQEDSKIVEGYIA